MAKRLSQEEKREKFLRDCINMMFAIAGHEVGYDDIKDRKDDWYTQWTMTVAQNEEWQKWGIKELKKVFKYTEEFAIKQMAMIGLNYGLKFNDFELVK